MKKIISAAFVAALAVTSWLAIPASESDSGNTSTLTLTRVEALSRTELPELIVFCQKPYGLCWYEDEYKTCQWSGSMSTYCKS